MKYCFLLVTLIFGLSLNIHAITQDEAARMVDTAFARQFGSHYEHNVLFYDGTAFRIAYALARSGSVSSGGCGYNLINACIAVTFDLAADSLGAVDEGTTILKMNPSLIPTLDSALMMVNRFLEQTVQGPAGIGQKDNTSREAIKKTNLRIQSPNKGKFFRVFQGNDSSGYPNEIEIFSIDGRYIGRALIDINNGTAQTNKTLSHGRYIGIMERGGKKYAFAFIVVR